MKISELMYKLQSAINEYSDLTVCTTFDGEVQTVDITPSQDGIVSHKEPNEITLDMMT